MLGAGYEAATATLVGIRDELLTPTEFEEFLQHMQKLDVDAFAKNIEKRVVILVTMPGTPGPDAHWRKRYAQHALESRGQTFFALVTDSAIQRGALTAIRWFTRSEKTSSHPFATFEEACAAAEKYRGTKLPQLRRLFETAETMRKAARARL